MKTVSIPIGEIRLDCETQPRVELDDDTIRQYRDIVAGGKTLPPADVFSDGPYKWIADGRHRLAAYKAEGLEYIDCFLHDGTVEDAFLFGLQKNLEHGKSLTSEDKVKSIKMILALPQYVDASDGVIADMVRCSHKFVGNVRASLGQQPGKRKGKDGKYRKPKKPGKVKTERQPGDDTAEEKADSKRRPGKELVNFPRIRSVYGKLARSLTAIGNTHRGERLTDEFKVCRDSLSTFAKSFKVIQGRLEK